VADFDFQGNSKELFDTLAKAGPLPMRGMIKKALTKALAEIAGGETATVEPRMVIEAVKKSTPKPFVGSALKSVKALYTCSSLCAGCTDSCVLAP